MPYHIVIARCNATFQRQIAAASCISTLQCRLLAGCNSPLLQQARAFLRDQGALSTLDDLEALGHGALHAGFGSMRSGAGAEELAALQAAVTGTMQQGAAVAEAAGAAGGMESQTGGGKAATGGGYLQWLRLRLLSVQGVLKD